jgi:hypothetical protein
MWFAEDSPLEGDGFEPSVPRQIFWPPVDPSAIHLPQYKPAPCDRDRWFESISLQRRVVPRATVISIIPTLHPRSIRRALEAPCDRLAAMHPIMSRGGARATLPSVIGGVVAFHIPSAASISAITASVSQNQVVVQAALWNAARMAEVLAWLYIAARKLR